MSPILDGYVIRHRASSAHAWMEEGVYDTFSSAIAGMRKRRDDYRNVSTAEMKVVYLEDGDEILFYHSYEDSDDSLSYLDAIEASA